MGKRPETPTLSHHNFVFVLLPVLDTELKGPVSLDPVEGAARHRWTRLSFHLMLMMKRDLKKSWWIVSVRGCSMRGVCALLLLATGSLAHRFALLAPSALALTVGSRLVTLLTRCFNLNTA